MTTSSEQFSTTVDDGFQTGTEQTTSTDGTSTTAQREATHVKETALSEAQDVAQTAKEQTQAVVADVRQQAQTLLSESRDQLSGHAVTQRDRAVDTLRSLAGELEDMASSQSSESRLGAQLAREGGQRAHQVADFLADRDPSQLLDEVRELGRRRPGAFLVGATIAGVVVGRLSRGAMSAKKSSSASTNGTSMTSTPTLGETSTYGTSTYDDLSTGTSPGLSGAPIGTMGDLDPSAETSVHDSVQDGYR